uniref:Peptidase C1A papain C-terminal domain-containing protein n=1 Tax=Meloidogyne floridensis TaxID=298350 RepID=A0A915P500_9BILA
LFGKLPQPQIKEVVAIVDRIKREYKIELSLEQIKAKIEELEKFKKDTEGSKKVGFTLYHFLPIEEQMKLLGGGNGISDVNIPDIHVNGEGVFDGESPPDPIEDNKEDEHPRNKRADCIQKNVFSCSEKWTGCAPIINRVHHQGRCASCWAIAPSTVYTDRVCIERAKKKQSTPNNASYIFSALDILSCSDAGDCVEGSAYKAWLWLKSKGVCTGGDNVNKGGCKPYPFTKSGNAAKPKCDSSCTASWPTHYFNDKRHISRLYAWGGNSITAQNIIKELEANGPVVVILKAYSDLYAHIGGVYHKSSDAEFRTNHVVSIVGHGIEVCDKEYPYWIIKNSWGTEFAES